MEITLSAFRKGMLLALICLSQQFLAIATDQKLLDKVDQEVTRLMRRGDIPGLSLVIHFGDEQVIRTYGFADLTNQVPVSDQTLFQLGSCSKAFTGLAVTLLEQQGKIDLDARVAHYLPWFRVRFEDSMVQVTLRQLMHHTSGIPWETIAKIPESNDPDALQLTVKKIIDQQLDELPGKEFQYATINYDVLALVIQEVTGQPFEDFVKDHVLAPLQLRNTSIGSPINETRMSKGYKLGFFNAREYEAPVYRGNNAAGYMISDIRDIGRWMQLQLGLVETNLSEAILQTHQRDRSVGLHGQSAYASGWNVAFDGTEEVYHGGMNPNFSSYFAFRSEEKIAVGVLTNASSNYTAVLGDRVMKLLADEDIELEFDPGDGNDKTYSGIAIALALYVLIVLAFLILIIVQSIQGKRRVKWPAPSDFGAFAKALLFIAPFLGGLYIFPGAVVGFTWDAILVWSPESLMIMLGVLFLAIGLSMLVYLVSLFLSEPNDYKRKAPRILLISILSGLANVAVIIIVTSVINSDVALKYLIFYYGLVISLYLFGRRFVQISLIKFTRELVYDLRIQLTSKIFSTSYDKFERIHRGRVYTALNDDVATIGNSTSLFVNLITSFITALGAFIYLAAIAFWATMLTIFLIITLSTIYYFAVQSTNIYFEQARDSRNVFMGLINGMIDGFKEISLHRKKKLEYKDDLAASAREFKDKTMTADIRFVNAFLIGESLLVILLGVVSIGMTEMFPNIQFFTVMSFVIVLLYLIGPVNSILSAVPALMNLRISWNRINQFISEIPANLDLDQKTEPEFEQVERLEAKGITYQFKNAEGKAAGFRVGPIDLEVNKGEILFIIGGNGSGKTTLAKLLLGLYLPDEGEITVNDTALKNAELSEYYSPVFTPPYLFEKLYNCDTTGQKEKIEQYLQVLDLQEKVTIENNQYSTIRLSGGQKKRLALLQCYLEDSPIYLFDEWAADQDPEYRKFFYRTLLPEMREMGKIVIAITHDDHYFDVADRVMKMNQGHLELYSKGQILAPSEL
ncbi:MAG: cyclic peptide export ABC transporter [Cytophagales bacterium]|nr:cyclic peptide export ABC transporter [Cytophagales bacterium]